MNITYIKITIFFAIFFSSFCFSQIKDNFDKDKIVAEVDSIKMTAEEFFYSYEYGPAFVKRKADSKKRHINYMINEKLLALDGYLRGIDTTEEAEEILNEFISDIATEELFKEDILSRVNIRDDEVDMAVNKKQIALEIKWLYSDSEIVINDYLKKMKNGITFDSLFNSQINDSVFYDDRYLKNDRFKLEQKNSLLAKIIDSLKAGEISLPVHADDGWYILKLENVTHNIITTESEKLRLEQEAVNALTKIKMDLLSDQYVNELMMQNQPTIKRTAFNFIRSYLGKYLLDTEKYNEWNLESKLNEAIKSLDIPEEKYQEAVLVELKNDSFSVKDFLTWYRSRSNYIKTNKNNIENFSNSLESLIWRMVRDRLLSQRAGERGLTESESVVKQSQWWKDKVVSAIVKNEIANSIRLENNELQSSDDNIASAKVNEEFTAKLLRKILSLKQKYRVVIDESALEAVRVTTENDPKAVEFYTVKRGGLIPRTPYPTIDFDWSNWE